MTKIPEHMADHFIKINGVGVTHTEAKLIVLHLHCFTQKQMGDFLDLTESTVKTYVRFLHNKLNVHCISELIRFSIKGGVDIDGMYEDVVILDLDKIMSYKVKYGIRDFGEVRG